MKYLSFYGNLYKCPWGCRLGSCPVNQVEHLSFESKFIWFETLSPEEKESIIEHHTQCAEKRAFKKVLV